jgi:hypothetical protein
MGTMGGKLLPHPRDVGAALRAPAFFDLISADGKPVSIDKHLAALVTGGLLTRVARKVSGVNIL